MIRITQFVLPSWRLILHLAWALWWGGIFFYAAIAVPIGTGSIGSIEQGFITQKVSLVHNSLASAFVFCLAVETVRTRNALLGLLTALLTVNVVFLIRWHSHLTSLMDFQGHGVSQGFYGQHAIYLWLITLEWVQGIIVPLVLFPFSAKRESA